MSFEPVAAGTLVFAAAGSVGLSVRAAQRGVVRGRAGGADRPRDAWRAATAIRGLSPRSARAVSGAGGAMVGALLAGLPGLVLGGVGGLAAPTLVRRRRAAHTSAVLEDQLAEAVSSVAAALRSGMSLSRSLELAADESDPPLCASLGEVVHRIALGTPLATAIEGWAKAEPGRDVRLVAGVLQLHRRSGGDLPSVLDRVTETLRERRAASQEIRSLTAQARLSGAILGLLPICFFAFLWVTSRRDIEAAVHSSLGLSAIVVGLVLQAVAFAWIRRLLRVEVA